MPKTGREQYHDLFNMLQERYELELTIKPHDHF